MVDQDPPALIFLDMQMPDDGPVFKSSGNGRMARQSLGCRRVPKPASGQPPLESPSWPSPSTYRNCLR